jgi:DNA-binding CsgD family transcriptional regulator
MPSRRPRSSPAPTQTVDDFLASLHALDLDGPSAVHAALPMLREAFHLDYRLSYRLGPAEAEGHDGVDFFVESGASFEQAFRRGAARRMTLRYDPALPEPAQRNRVFVWSFAQARFPPPLARRFHEVGLAGAHQMRALLCEGATLLAWFGGLRFERPSASEARLFARLIAPMRRRLALELRLGDAALWKTGLAAALEALPAPAFIASAHGAVRHANPLGIDALERAPSAVAARLRAAIAGAHPELEVTPLKGRGLPRHFLVIERRHPRDTAERVARARVDLRLTPREAEVLGLLASGEPTRAIADRLGCAMRTVEAHATAIFRKAKVGSRAALLARFWSR